MVKCKNLQKLLVKTRNRDWGGNWVFHFFWGFQMNITQVLKPIGSVPTKWTSSTFLFFLLFKKITRKEQLKKEQQGQNVTELPARKAMAIIHILVFPSQFIGIQEQKMSFWWDTDFTGMLSSYRNSLKRVDYFHVFLTNSAVVLSIIYDYLHCELWISKSPVFQLIL